MIQLTNRGANDLAKLLARAEENSREWAVRCDLVADAHKAMGDRAVANYSRSRAHIARGDAAALAKTREDLLTMLAEERRLRAADDARSRGITVG
jgi:hypothetical protein